MTKRILSHQVILLINFPAIPYIFTMLEGGLINILSESLAQVWVLGHNRKQGKQAPASWSFAIQGADDKVILYHQMTCDS